jgi:hypothetical protein
MTAFSVGELGVVGGKRPGCPPTDRRLPCSLSDDARSSFGRQPVSGVPPPSPSRAQRCRKAAEAPNGATAAPKAKRLLAAAFPVQSLLKAA